LQRGCQRAERLENEGADVVQPIARAVVPSAAALLIHVTGLNKLLLMTELLQWLGKQPPALWVSIAALLLSAGSLIHAIRTGRAARRLNAYEKRTEVLAILTEARFTMSQVLIRLRSHRPWVAAGRPEVLPSLDEHISKGEEVESHLEAEFMATLATPPDIDALEKRRQDASVDLKSVRSVMDGLSLVEKRFEAGNR